MYLDDSKRKVGAATIFRFLFSTPTGFENWKNHHSASTYYNSGKVTVGTIDAQLGSGTYFLVFDNTFSLLSNKAISSDIKIQ